MPSWRFIAVCAALLGLLAVVLGAVGAHAVPLDDATAQRQWATAWHLHLFHTASLLALAALARQSHSALLLGSGLALLAGCLLFSGSLYLRILGWGWIPGPVTPFGGVLMMFGWLLAAVSLARSSRI